MNIFVLTTGRAGSVAFIAACQHINNLSAAHESRVHLIGEDHFNYPENHIEADNRLSWFLGTLDRKFGDRAMYVHLTRDRETVAKSYLKRYEYERGIIKAYHQGILRGNITGLEPLEICLDYCDTVNDNIRHFLKDKTNTMEIHLERILEQFPIFWERVAATGDLNAALLEWSEPRNQSVNFQRHGFLPQRVVRRVQGVLRRVFPNR
jgi:hypothetical protein